LPRNASALLIGVLLLTRFSRPDEMRTKCGRNPDEIGRNA
jgi:hypothetical protein